MINLTRPPRLIPDAAMMAVLAGRRTGLKEYQRAALANPELSESR